MAPTARLAALEVGVELGPLLVGQHVPDDGDGLAAVLAEALPQAVDLLVAEVEALGQELEAAASGPRGLV